MTTRRQRTLRAGYLGRLEYGQATALQERLRADVRAGDADYLLLLEHPHIYTLGRSASEGDVLLSPEMLAGEGIDLASTDRGGQVTYHGPGQLVGYPILNLAPDRKDVRRYVRDLQEVLVRVLEGFGITAAPGREQAEIGVWVEERKIASIGVHLSRWVTTHGFALNVATDLSLFAGIVACGLPGVVMTSIEHERPSEVPALKAVAVAAMDRFAEVFDYERVAELPAAVRGADRVA